MAQSLLDSGAVRKPEERRKQRGPLPFQLSIVIMAECIT